MWMVRFGTAATWALAAAVLTFWGLKWSARPEPDLAPMAAWPQPAVGDLGSLLGTAKAPAVPLAVVPTSSRFRLTGVLSPENAGAVGVAVIATDNGPPKAYRTGTLVDANYRLGRVSPRSAELVPITDDSPAARVNLSLPSLPTAAMGGERGAPAANRPVVTGVAAAVLAVPPLTPNLPAIPVAAPQATEGTKP